MKKNVKIVNAFSLKNDIKRNSVLVLVYAAAALYVAAVAAVDIPTFYKVREELTFPVRQIASLIVAGGEFIQWTLPLYAIVYILLLTILFLRGKALIIIGILLTLFSEFLAIIIRYKLSSALSAVDAGNPAPGISFTVALFDGIYGAGSYICMAAILALLYWGLLRLPFAIARSKSKSFIDDQ